MCFDVTRQGFYWYLKHRDDPWKYENIAEKMRVIVEEDECNDTYERCRMNQALKLKYPNEDVPSERTVYRIMERIGLSHRPNRKPHGITKADRNARKSGESFEPGFQGGEPTEEMCDRYHRDSSKEWETLCFRDLRLLRP